MFDGQVITLKISFLLNRNPLTIILIGLQAKQLKRLSSHQERNKSFQNSHHRKMYTGFPENYIISYTCEGCDENSECHKKQTNKKTAKLKLLHGTRTYLTHENALKHLSIHFSYNSRFNIVHCSFPDSKIKEHLEKTINCHSTNQHPQPSHWGILMMSKEVFSIPAGTAVHFSAGKQ